jgi:hypothetical protein
VIPWYQYPAHAGYQPNLFTPYVFGGFKAPILEPDGYTADCEVYPAEIRPLNKYVDRNAQGKAVIDVFIDPADQSHGHSIIGQGGEFAVAGSIPAWQHYGTSYSLNVRWAQGYSLPNGNYSLEDFRAGRDSYPNRLAQHLFGGKAARFVFWVEQDF